jgi:uncharacterized damage-inducible protein DinB
MRSELQQFSSMWESESSGTVALLKALPPGHYDFRPDGGRSIGELAWHLAEIDAYTTLGIEQRSFTFTQKPAHIGRPRTIDELAPAFQIVHAEAAARVARLQHADLEQEVQYADGVVWPIRDLLWRKLLMHSLHHRGQLMLLCRLAGGVPPPLFGRTRELMPARPPAVAAT